MRATTDYDFAHLVDLQRVAAQLAPAGVKRVPAA